MKIIKILFLGIVLVIFNIAYLAAQTLPDSVSLSASAVEPGNVLTVTLDVRFHSSSVGGFILVASGLPAGMITTGDGVNLAEGDMPTAPGTWAYEWTEGYGAIIAANATNPIVDIDIDDATGGGIISAIVLGANVGLYLGLPPAFGGIDPANVGAFAKLYINVPEDMAEGTYDLAVVGDEGLSMQPYPIDGPAIEGTPYFNANSIVVFNIPDNNYIDMVDASQGVASDGYTAISIMIANRDTVASAMFDVTFPGSYMTLDSVVAGSHVEGANVSYTPPAEPSTTALAADMATTISVSGDGVLTPGGGELARLYFNIGTVGAGVAASVALSNYSMKDPNGADLTLIAPPSGGSTSLSFSYGDTLSFADMMGEGTAIIIDGQLHVPIVLKNASSVSAVSFYISEPAGMEDILSLSDDVVMHENRAAGWTVVAADSGSYVQIISYAPTVGSAIAPGEGQLYHVVFDINTSAFTVPSPGSTVDLTLGLAGVELVSSGGTFLGVEAMGGVASLDYRVPLDGEGVGPGASLPKAFALAQNHPNPFNPSTTINYQIPDEVGSVNFQLNVYDIRGKLVRALDKGLKGAGTYSVYWDGTDDYGRKVSSGVYFYRFTSSKYNATRKMIMLK